MSVAEPVWRIAMVMTISDLTLDDAMSQHMMKSPDITGATGYIGGDALTVIVEKHPDWNITCLVRNSDKGAKIASRYASIRLVYGDLDSVDLIEEEASKADIVYNFANCDHEESAHAIARGLARRTDEGPGFWIHTSGAMILALETIKNNLYGEKPAKVYNDFDGIGELTSISHEAPHRVVDEIVLNASATHTNVKTAIVCPPTIYGLGRGPDNQRSMQAYQATAVFLGQQRAVELGRGQNVWHQIHVYDLSQLYLLLGEAAAAGGPPATWDDQGYYLAENGEFMWSDILHEIAKVAHQKGLLPSDVVESISLEDSTTLAASTGRRLHLSVGTTSRGISIRGKKLLGWNPKERSLKEEVPDIVDSEAKRLGLVEGHAVKVEKGSK